MDLTGKVFRSFTSIRSFSKYVRKEKKLAQVEEKQRLRPVIIEGSVIARSWWGKAWNENLEFYAEYSNLIGRGRSHVRSGAILGLQVSAGEVKALVRGSRAKPYAVQITIKKLNKNTWNQLTSACEGNLRSLEELLAGKFPEVSRRRVHAAKDRVVPITKGDRICASGRDGRACAGTLQRRSLASVPGLTKSQRSFLHSEVWDAADLIRRDVSSKAEDLLQKASKKSSRPIEGADLSAACGVDLADDAAAAKIAMEESARMADVRKVLKKQLKMDAKLTKKEKTSTTSGAKKKGRQTKREGNSGKGCEQTVQAMNKEGVGTIRKHPGVGSLLFYFLILL